MLLWLLLKRIWLYVLLYFRGIRFFETNIVPTGNMTRRAVFKTNHEGQDIVFSFFREESEDVIYRHYQFSKQKFVGYVVQADFPEKVPAEVRRFNSVKIFFNTHHYLAHDEAIITEMLLHIYLDFIKSQLG